MLKFARKITDLGIEGKKAQQYDEFSRKSRMSDFAEYAKVAARYLGAGRSVLDVATGPGYFCTELAKLNDFKIIGVDISEDLLAIARTNARAAGVEVGFQRVNAAAMQFPDEAFDLVFCSWAIKNFKDPSQVLNEMYRVLKPGGTALIVDVNREATGSDWKGYALAHDLSGITALTMGIAFRIQKSGAYSQTQFEHLISGTPFSEHHIQRAGINLQVILSK